MPDVRRLVGKRIQILRKRKDFSQEELAGKIGIDTKSLSRLERGTHFPSLETLDRIHLELGVELKDFFKFDDRPSAEELREFLLRTSSDADYATLLELVKAVQMVLTKMP
jgi:transcriptional regulator with XRE-family HTH domain